MSSKSSNSSIASDPDHASPEADQLLELARQCSEIDPSCLADRPKVITFQDVSEASYKIRGGIERTPCQRSYWLSNFTGFDLWLKKDYQQVTGSFKERGARFALLKLPVVIRQKGVVAASAGNHALALAYHGQQLAVPVTVCVPVIAPMVKISRCKSFGAEVIIHGNDMAECKAYAIHLAKTRGQVYVNGYDHPHIMAGAGTAGLEIVEDVPNIDAVIIPTGGGGLLAGCAVAIKYLYPNVQIISAESVRCASFARALEAGKPVLAPCGPTLADGLAVPKVGYNAFETAKNLVDRTVEVQEEFIALTILRLVEMEKVVVEGAGALSVAALLSGQLNDLKGKRVVALISGGNIDTTTLGRCLERGLAADGRYCRMIVTVKDAPGGIAELAALLQKCGASIKDITHDDRTYLKMDIFAVRVKLTVETRDFNHCRELERELRKQYDEVWFNSDY